jgi:ketosteroid isomerase-like protein
MKQSTEINAAFSQYLTALGTGDVETIEALFSKESGVRVIGTDPREWWSGHEQIVRMFTAQQAELGEFSITPSDSEAFEEGSIGWAAAKFTATIGDYEMNGRISAVFRQEDGAWKIVQSHGSIGAANEEEFGKELTTE